MTQFIGQRELRNDNAEIMRRVEAGEHYQAGRRIRRRTVGEVQAEFRRMTPLDSERWRRERVEADAVFGPDDPFEDPRNPTDFAGLQRLLDVVAV